MKFRYLIATILLLPNVSFGQPPEPPLATNPWGRLTIATGGPVVFRWLHVEGATTYKIELVRPADGVRESIAVDAADACPPPPPNQFHFCTVSHSGLGAGIWRYLIGSIAAELQFEIIEQPAAQLQFQWLAPPATVNGEQLSADDLTYQIWAGEHSRAECAASCEVDGEAPDSPIECTIPCWPVLVWEGGPGTTLAVSMPAPLRYAAIRSIVPPGFISDWSNEVSW